ncbi:hypothetical protein [Thermaurantiacus sp.]
MPTATGGLACEPWISIERHDPFRGKTGSAKPGAHLEQAAEGEEAVEEVQAEVEPNMGWRTTSGATSSARASLSSLRLRRAPTTPADVAVGKLWPAANRSC